jgi:uracil-DNA glycosylase
MQELENCRLCASRFAATATQHRPVLWFQHQAKVLIAGQAPGARVHESGRPFADPSGDRLRRWLGLDEAGFYDKTRIAIVPMGFCFPGYNAKGADLPPPPICAKTWRRRVMESLPNIKLKILVGSYAIRWHLGEKGTLSDIVKNWRAHAPQVFPLPHPSWRNTAWLKRNPFFEAEVLPALRLQLHEVLKDE